MDAFVGTIRDYMRNPGWAVQGVAPSIHDEPGSDHWVYTIGLWENYGHPEILIVNMGVRAGHQLLNELGARVRDDGERFEPGEPRLDVLQAADAGEPLGVSTPVKFVTVDRRNYRPWFNVARQIYNSSAFEAIQMLWPDREGRLPDEPGYDGEKFPQPVLAAG